MISFAAPAASKRSPHSYPDEYQLQISLAQAHNELGNVKKAAAILESVPVSKLAAPDQLRRLAWMLLLSEQLAVADKVLARLREVAPEDEDLPSLEAYAQNFRGQHAAALATISKVRDHSKLDSRLSVPRECHVIALSGDTNALRSLIERSREPEKPLAVFRPTISRTCLAFGLIEEAAEQIAIMLAEGAINADALVGYAQVALARGDVAEARHLVSVADRLPQIPMPDRDERLARAHLALGDYATAAKLYLDSGTHATSHSSSYSLCMAALTSRLAGDATQADECLKLAATMQGDSDWPRLAIQFISGRISEEEFRNAPERTTTTPMMRASRQCEVLCIIRHDKRGQTRHPRRHGRLQGLRRNRRCQR